MQNLLTYLHLGVKGMQNRHLPPLLRFIPQFAQICIIFALRKFEANPFFPPVVCGHFMQIHSCIGICFLWMHTNNLVIKNWYFLHGFSAL